MTFGFTLNALRDNLVFVTSTVLFISVRYSINQKRSYFMMNFDKRCHWFWLSVITTHQYVTNVGVIDLEYLFVAFDELVTMETRNRLASTFSNTSSQFFLSCLSIHLSTIAKQTVAFQGNAMFVTTIKKLERSYDSKCIWITGIWFALFLTAFEGVTYTNI